MDTIPQPEEVEKRCTGPCKQSFPENDQFFYKKSPGKKGLDSFCKKCRYRYNQENKKKPKVPKPPIPDGCKHCTGCGLDHPATLEYFGIDKRKKDGLRQPCRDCRSKEDKEYRKEHHEEYLQEEQRRREAYSESITRAKQNYQRSPRGRVAGATSTRNRRIRQKRILGTHTTQQIQEQLKRQKIQCYYCRKKFEKKQGRFVYHVDHTFPLSRVADTDIPANDISYLVLACPECNIKKGNKFPHEWPEGGRLL